MFSPVKCSSLAVKLKLIFKNIWLDYHMHFQNNPYHNTFVIVIRYLFGNYITPGDNKKCEIHIWCFQMYNLTSFYSVEREKAPGMTNILKLWTPFERHFCKFPWEQNGILNNREHKYKISSKESPNSAAKESLFQSTVHVDLLPVQQFTALMLSFKIKLKYNGECN